MLKTRLPLILSAALIAASLTGCEASKAQTEQWADEGAQRWYSLKSEIALQMAEDQFNSGQLSLAENTIEESMVKDMENPGLWLMAGRIALEESKLETAYQRLNKAIAYGEENPNISIKDKAKPYYYQGIVNQRWQRYDDAKAKYTLAYERDPEDVAYFLATVEMTIQLGQLDQAVEQLEDKAGYFDQNATVRALLGHVKRRQAKHAEAAMWFRQASMLAPEDMKLREEVARSLFDTGRFEEASRALRELIDTEYAGTRPDLHRLLAKSYVNLDKLREAREVYNTITQLDPTSTRDWYQLGELAFRLGDEGTTLRAANRLINLTPDHYRGYLLAGMVWNRRDQLDRALSMFDRAAQLAPQQTIPLILRGMALQKNGRPAAAADAYKQALALDPDNARVQQLLTSVTEGLR